MVKGALSKTERKKLKKLRKRCEKGKGSRRDFLDVYGAQGSASLELRDAASMTLPEASKRLSLREVQGLMRKVKTFSVSESHLSSSLLLNLLPIWVHRVVASYRSNRL